MKILQVAPYFKPYIGGQESYIYNLSKKLIEMGHDVHVLTSNYPKTNYFEQIDGITIERKDIKMRPLRNPVSMGFFDVGKIADQFDVVHMHNSYAFSSMVTAYYKNKMDFPLILTSHGKLGFGVNYKDLFVKFYSNRVASKILEKVDRIVMLSKSQGDYVAFNNPHISDKIKIIPNALDLKLFKELDINSNENEKDCFTFLYIGQLIKRKGLKWLIKAFKIVKKENSQIKLILVGEGDQRKYFEQMVDDMGLKGSVEFKGGINDKLEIASIYKNSDVFVLPSLSEGLPTVILEAMYYGLPVIATDILGIKEHFKDYAILVPPRNEKELADAMINLFDDCKLNKAIRSSKKCKKLIETKYSWDCVAKQYEELYEDICQ
jgi:glycosyltransferase involved in cell wall biosynthesis